MSNDAFALIIDAPGEQAHAQRSSVSHQEWMTEQEGQLAVDVIEQKNELVVVSTLAGAITEKLEVYIHDDLLTIRGIRRSPLAEEDNLSYVHRECFWGQFSRTIVLPADVKGAHANAEYKNGILVVRLPKQHIDKKIPIMIVEE